MSSRYNWALPESCRSVDRVAGAAPLAPVTGLNVVRLRRGGSVNQALDMLAHCGKFQLTGPPGCGKSTTVPHQLAGVGSLAVLHLVPHPLQAMQLNMSAGRNESAVHLAMKDLFAGEAVGVLVISYCNFWSYLLRHGLSLDKLRENLVLYCDESHESDAGTYTFVRYASSNVCPNRVVLVSATLDGQEFATEESLFACEDRVVDMKVEDALSNILPCVVKDAVTKVMLFTDDPGLVARTKLIAQKIGYDTHSLHSRSEPSEFQAVAAANAGGKPWFCVVDSSYRTGFNLPVNLVFDSALVGFTSHVDGVRRYRPAFGFETYQAKGRLGRDQASGGGVYVRIRGPMSDLLTRIEGAEMPMAYTLARAFGLVLTELSIPGLGGKRVVLNNYANFNGKIPVNLLPDSAFSNPAQAVGKSVADKPSAKTVHKGNCTEYELVGAFNKLVSKLTEARISTTVGPIYCVPGNMETLDRSPMFPNGTRSILEALANGRLIRLIGFMSDEDRELFLRVSTFEMSQASIKHIASLQFIKEVCQSSARFSSEQKTLLVKLQDDLAIASAGYRKLAEALILLQRENPIDVIELADTEVADVVGELRDALSADFASKADKAPGRSALPTLDDVLPGGRRLAELPNAAIREQYNPRALLAGGDSRRVSGPQTNSSGSGRSIPEWERKMFRVKKFDGISGRLVMPD